MGQSMFGVAARGNELGNDGDSYFFWRYGANVEPDGRMDTAEEFRVEAFARELAKDRNRFAFGADHADVASRRLHCPTQYAHVVAMAARGDDDVRGFNGAEILQRIVEVFGDDLKRFGEALGVGVGLAVVGDDAVEARVAGRLEELYGDMTGAKDVKKRDGEHRLDKDFKRASADEASVVFRVLIEIESEGARLFLGDDFAGSLPDFGLDAAAADGTGDGAIIANKHFGALERGDGATRVHDCSHSATAALALQFHDLLIDVHPFQLLVCEGAKSNRGGRMAAREPRREAVAALRESSRRLLPKELI